METVIAFLEQTLKRDQAIKDALPDIKALYNISAQVKELEVRKNALQIDLEARTEALKATEVESTVLKEKAASELLKAQKEAQALKVSAGIEVAQILNAANDEAKDILAQAEVTADAWVVEAADAEAQTEKAKEDYAHWQQKLLNVQAELAKLKANL